MTSIFSIKKSFGISTCIPAPSPVFPSEPTPPLCVILTRASIDLVKIESTLNDILLELKDLGYDVLFLNYRGFGKSDGSIENEKQLLNDAQIVYDDLKKEYGEENIIILGTSVGTGIGSFLASKNSPKKLILVAPYSNFKVLQKEKIKFVPDFIFRYELNSNDFLEGVRCPVIIFHGKKDQRIPFYHAERLKSNHEKIKLISFENYNHVDFLKESIYLNEIEKGKKLALVGRTGAGKTSIVSVLNRFYDINSGVITIDGINVKDIALANLRKNIALVQQEVFLFSDSILNNITLFDATVSRETVVAAAKEIGVDEFINSLPGNYDYVVGERGVTLSAGQRQLIAFLRVYIRDPKILILDEATASIDTATEELLQLALEKLSTNRTTIVIAHRLSTIVNADKILHLKNGNVLEEGTHQELLKFKDAYSEMFSKQSDADLNA